MDEENNQRRTSTNDSKFYHDETIKTRKCICESLLGGFESDDDDDSFLNHKKNTAAKDPKNQN